MKNQSKFIMTMQLTSGPSMLRFRHPGTLWPGIRGPAGAGGTAAGQRGQTYKIWTEADEDFLSRNHQNPGTRKLAALMGMTRNAASKKAGRMGIMEEGNDHQRRRGTPWSEAQEEFLRRNYQGVNYRDLAALMGTTERAVACKINRLGLTEKKDAQRWTPEEDDRLRDLVGRKDVTTAARETGRSIRAVRVRASQLRISWRDHDGWYDVGEASRILGADEHWIVRRIQSGTLRGRNTGKPGARHNWRVREADLRAFLRRYPHELVGRDVDLVKIVEILAGLDYPE